jgi:hypothetical protein
MITDSEIEKALDYLRGNATKAAQAKANREYLDEYKKVLKSQIMREVEGESLGAAEARAYADPRYKTHLEAFREAIEQDTYYQWMRVAAEAKISAWQTQQATERATRI